METSKYNTTIIINFLWKLESTFHQNLQNIKWFWVAAHVFDNFYHSQRWKIQYFLKNKAKKYIYVLVVLTIYILTYFWLNSQTFILAIQRAESNSNSRPQAQGFDLAPAPGRKLRCLCLMKWSSFKICPIFGLQNPMRFFFRYWEKIK